MLQRKFKRARESEKVKKAVVGSRKRRLHVDVAARLLKLSLIALWGTGASFLLSLTSLTSIVSYIGVIS
jgi:hypothetical protein